MTVNIWGNVGNQAYALPMVKLVPFDVTTKQVLGWNPTEGALDYLPLEVDPATAVVTAAADLFIPATKGYYVGLLKVVGARRTGWTVATGTATRTAFDTGTVTTTQLAERVKALIDDLVAHGLIGT